jgi:hypothetical protein
MTGVTMRNRQMHSIVRGLKHRQDSEEVYLRIGGIIDDSLLRYLLLKISTHDEYSIVEQQFSRVLNESILSEQLKQLLRLSSVETLVCSLK